jgi:hypothetical protein
MWFHPQTYRKKDTFICSSTDDRKLRKDMVDLFLITDIQVKLTFQRTVVIIYIITNNFI